MPIDLELAHKLLSAAFRSYAPVPEKADQARLAAKFAALASSEAQARRMIAQMETVLHFYPKIADLHEASEALRAEALSDVPEFKPHHVWQGECAKCNGTGFVSSTKIIEGVPHDFARHCECRRGAAA